MDFSLSSEQEMIRDSVNRFVEKNYSFNKYLETVSTDSQMQAKTWQQFAEFGWLGQPLPEAAGGYGGDAVDTSLITEGLGNGMVLEPFIASVVFAGNLIAKAGNSDQHEALIAPLVEGNKQLAVAFAERISRYNPAWCATTAKASDDGYVLAGEKHGVANGANAETFIISARTSGKAGETAGISLFIVDANTPGLTVKSYKTLGGGTAAELTLNDVRVGDDALLGAPGEGFAPLEHALDYAIAAACADALGAMKALLKRTAEYAGQRKQFGVPIGSFQVIQHKLVDMFIEVEQSTSMVLQAAVQADNDDRIIRRKAISGAKAYLNKSSKFVAQWAVQLHGGIGVTEELDVGHYFRRLTGFNLMFGDREYHLKQFATLSCDVQAESAQQAAA